MFNIFVVILQPIKVMIMNTVANKTNGAFKALEKAMEVRRVWMQALSGKIGKEELDAKGIRFMAISE